MTTFLRMQDAQGRGPFRPGFTHKWLNKTDAEMVDLPAIHQELLSFHQIVAREHRKGFHLGNAAEGWEQFHRWFNQNEVLTLAALGFSIVDCSACRLIARTPNQVFIGSRYPLSFLPKVQP